MKSVSLVTALAGLASVVPLASAATGYIQLAPAANLTTTGGTVYTSTTIVGSTAYNVFGGTSTKEIAATTGLGGSATSTALTNSAAITAATGSTSQIGGLIYSANATTLQIADSGTDDVYRINRTTGAISQYVSKAVLQATNPTATAFNAFVNGVSSTGEAVVYDNTAAAPRFVITTGPGTASGLATLADVQAVLPTSTITGFTVGPSNTLIITDGTNGRVIQYNPATSSGSVLLTSANITSVTGGAAPTFQATSTFFAPDGLAYFYENTSDSILSFNPSNPAATLTTVLSSAQLLTGPAASKEVNFFTYYNTNIAWGVITPTGRGLYAVPEPASLGVLALGGLALRRRRR